MLVRLRPVLLLVAASSIALATVAVGTRVAMAASGTGYETREQFIYNLDVNLNVAPVTPATQQFSDVPPSDPLYGYIAAAVTQGWINGLPDGTFDPQGPLTREAIAKIEVLALGKGAAAQALQGHTPAFSDGASIPSWAWGYINEAVSLGILHGEAAGQFDPGGYLTVAQETHAVAQLSNYMSTSGSDGGQPATPTSLTAGTSGSQAVAGVPFTVSLTVQGDQGYTATDGLQVSLSTPDSGAVLPTSASFSNGAASVNVTLTTAQSNVITINDQTMGFTASLPITVGAGAPSKLVVTAPSQANVNAAFDVTLTLTDSFGNTVPFSGADTLLVEIPGDSGAVVPDAATFAAGVAEVSVTPTVAQQDFVTVAATADGVTVGGSATVQVAGGTDTLLVADSKLYAGGPIQATLEGATGQVSWRLVNPSGYTYPLFGSTSGTLDQDLEQDIVANTYTLVADDLSTGTSYKAAVNITSSYSFSVSDVTPSLVYNVQDMIPDFSADLYGQGETIALYEESGYLDSDIEQFDAKFGLPSPNITVYGPNGQTQPVDYSTSAGSNNGFEAAMDIEWAHAMAPLANIAVYEWPDDGYSAQHEATTAQDALSRGFNAVSYSFCLSGDDPTGGAADQEFASAAQSGLGVFASSGDHGQEYAGSTCWPSADPSVVSVGGVEYTSSYIDYWNQGQDLNTGDLLAGGYGVSDYTAAPRQAALGYDNGYRIVPDVSLVAENAATVFDGQDWTSGGTSLAAPCWAAIWALSDQEHGLVDGTGISAPASEVIYDVAADAQDEPAFFQQQGTAATFYQGIGFGSPDVAAFIYDLMQLY